MAMEQNDRPVGYTWLARQYALSTSPPSHESYIGERARLGAAPLSSVVVESFPPKYWPGDDPLDHVAFALKYDDLNLDLLRQLFQKLTPAEVIQYVESQPNGKYTRQIGYLYEFLTGNQLPLSVAIGGAYVNLLDANKYVVAHKVSKNARWHVNDNLLGSPRFCPVVRKKPIQEHLAMDFTVRLNAFRKQVPPELFQRAINYLYFKEAKSSYNIEREIPTPEREERFVAVLKNAGHDTIDEVLSEAQLTRLQNLIVEPRYAQQGFRTWQNYVGESPPGRSPIVHYVCPPGDMVQDLMTGLLECALKTEGIHAIVRAAMVSFGFVFAHPFEDGNGRIHRYLIHDFLGRDHIVPEGMVLPVSAYMLHHPQEYDRVLGNFSKPLRRVVRTTMDDEEALTITNPDEAAGYYRYPDLTAQVEYLLHVVDQTINTELVSEILFIRNYDAARSAIREIVDLPDRKLDKLIQLLHQNKGMLSKTKRQVFKELNDDEIHRMEAAFQSCFADQSVLSDLPESTHR